MILKKIHLFLVLKKETLTCSNIFLISFFSEIYPLVIIISEINARVATWCSLVSYKCTCCNTQQIIIVKILCLYIVHFNVTTYKISMVKNRFGIIFWLYLLQTCRKKQYVNFKGFKSCNDVERPLFGVFKS